MRRIGFKYMITGLLFFCGLVMLTGCSKKVIRVNKDTYDKISNGMTIAEVQAILGTGTIADATSSTANNSTSTQPEAVKLQNGVWVEDQRRIEVVFWDGKVLSKRWICNGRERESSERPSFQ